jgi:hypothetical protein
VSIEVVIAMRRSREETVAVSGPTDAWFSGFRRALEAEGFSSVEVSPQGRTMKAAFWKSRVRGELEVAFVEAGRDTNIAARATAEISNLDGLIWNPAAIIMAAFKQAVNRCLTIDRSQVGA